MGWACAGVCGGDGSWEEDEVGVRGEEGMRVTQLRLGATLRGVVGCESRGEGDGDMGWVERALLPWGDEPYWDPCLAKLLALGDVVGEGPNSFDV